MNTKYNSCEWANKSICHLRIINGYACNTKNLNEAECAFGTNKVSEYDQEYHNHAVQTNQQHCEEDPQNTNSRKASERQLSKATRLQN